MKNVAIIGAGAAGLCMARYLRANEKMFNFVMYERTNAIGGTWVYDENIPSQMHGPAGMEALRRSRDVQSSMYKNLRTNLPKQLMEYPDFAFPEEKKSFVSHRDVLAYLDDYAGEFGLKQKLLLNTNVDSVQALNQSQAGGDTKWKVFSTTNDSEDQLELDFDSVMVCNGHFTKPDIPDIAGIRNFKGSLLHSHLYRVPQPFKGKTVLVLGGSASGRDIAVEISRCADKVLLSHRGDAGICELPKNVTEHQPIKMVDNDGKLILMDDERCSVDAIVFCTGYLYEFPFLHESCGITVKENRVSPLYKQMFNIHNPSMAFIGVPSIICPFHLFSMQARWIINVLTGASKLPSKKEMMKDSDEELRLSLEAGIPEKYFHRFDKGTNLDYFKVISTFGNVEPIKTVFEKMFVKVKQEREQDLLYYRDREYVVKNDNEFEIITNCNSAAPRND